MCSDLHLEFRPRDILVDVTAMESFEGLKCLALLGDIGVVKGKNDEVEGFYRSFIMDIALKDVFDHIFVISGNHEYYENLSMEATDKTIADICAEATAASKTKG